MKYLWYKLLSIIFPTNTETVVQVVKVVTLTKDQFDKLENQLPNSLISSTNDSAEFKLGVQHALRTLRKGFVAE